MTPTDTSRCEPRRLGLRPAGGVAAAGRGAGGRRVLMLLENSTYPRDPRVRLEARTLTAAGYRVAVICPALPGEPWREQIDGVAVYRFPALRGANGLVGYGLEYVHAMLATAVLSLIVWASSGFDIVHAHNPPDTFVLVAAFYKLFGKRFVFDHHDLAPEMYRARFGARGRPRVAAVLGWLERLSCRLADRVIATNESYKAVELARGRVPESRISVVRNGPDLDRIRPVAPDAELRGLGKTIIAFVGVMGFQDGVDYLLRAVHRLVYDLDRADVYCVVIGPGDALADLRALATRLCLDGYVRFTGRLSTDELLPLLCAADIGVEPSPSNAYNDRSTAIKLMEYMALAKPLVAFDLPEHRVTAGEAALYARPNDELDFARCLVRLIDGPALRRRLGAVGRARVVRELAWRHQAPRLLEAYAALRPAGATRGSASP